MNDNVSLIDLLFVMHIHWGKTLDTCPYLPNY